MNVLALNAGSSGLKASLYRVESEPLPVAPPPPLWEGVATWGRNGRGSDLSMRTVHGGIGERTVNTLDPRPALVTLLASIWSGPERVLKGEDAIDVVGHRVVHGGITFRDTVEITSDARPELERLVSLAPLHIRLALDLIDETVRLIGGYVPQIAVFDTTFHFTMPETSYVYPGPYEWIEWGIRRFGFHGLSHLYATRRSAETLGVPEQSIRLIVCHLGRGCSITAVRDGRSIDTTMGFTPLEGVMMGSRSGSLDPGILIHLMNQRGLKADELDHLLNHESGLLGISGVSTEMEQVIAAMERGDSRSHLAFGLFAHSVRSHIGAMAASLGGIPDALVFTGGIGEHSPVVRSAVCAGLRGFGLELDEERNGNAPVDADIATKISAARILVVRSQENWQIAQECYRMVIQSQPRVSRQYP
jgi:acetate kinase